MNMNASRAPSRSTSPAPAQAPPRRISRCAPWSPLIGQRLDARDRRRSGGSSFALVSMATPLDKRRMQRASDDHRPAVAIYRAPLFNRSETFIRAHPLNLVRYRPLLAGLEDKGNIPPELEEALFLPRGPDERLRGRLGDLRWLA